MSSPQKAAQDQIERLETMKRNMSSPDKRADTRQSKSSRVDEETEDVQIVSESKAPGSGNAKSPGKNNESSGSGGVTLEAIKGLLTESLAPLNASMSGMKVELGAFKSEIKHEMKDIKGRVGQLEDGTKLTSIRIKEIESKLLDPPLISPLQDPQLTQKLKEIEQAMKELQVPGPPGTPTHASAPIYTAVIGGLSAFASLEEAEGWVRKNISDWKLGPPLKVFLKSTEGFQGLLFARFSTPQQMECVVNAFTTKSLKLKENTVWSKPERPLVLRAPINFLFGLKKMLVKWGYTKKDIYVDEELRTLEICKTPVLEASAKEGSLNLDWIVKDFEAWDELHNDSEFMELRKKFNDMLSSANEASKKGAGKGTKGGSL